MPALPPVTGGGRSTRRLSGVTDVPKLILASASHARRNLLVASGIDATVQVSGVDESTVDSTSAQALCLMFFQVEDGMLDLIVTGVQACVFFFSSRRRHTRSDRDWSSDVCSSDLSRRGAARTGAGRPPPESTP